MTNRRLHDLLISHDRFLTSVLHPFCFCSER